MNLTIAGQDRSLDIGADLTRRAARHQGALSPWAPQDSALSLRQSGSPSDYLARYVKLLQLRHALSTETFTIPGKPGVAGTLLRQIKGFLWKLLRYQHDRMAFQQNVINELAISALDFQRTTSQQTFASLEQRIKVLEAAIASRKEVSEP